MPVPWFGASDSTLIKITDEETNVMQEVVAVSTLQGNYESVSFDFDFIENRYYRFTVEVNRDEVYRGKIYCTNQSNLEKFSINRDEFTYYEDTDNDNQYIYR